MNSLGIGMVRLVDLVVYRFQRLRSSLGRVWLVNLMVYHLQRFNKRSAIDFHPPSFQ